MRTFMTFTALACALAAAAPASAGAPDGKFQVKVLASGVLPDGKISKVRSIDPALADTFTQLGVADVDAKANDNVVPTLAVEYFFTPQVSVETICCFTQHHVSGAADLQGAGLVDHVLILPATLTAKYHIPTGTPVTPYLGAGPALFLIFDERPGQTAAALGVDRVHMSNDLGAVLQAGLDVAVGDSGLGLSVDAKRYWIRPTASFYAGDAKVLETRHKLDPWVISAGVSYRF